MTILFANSETIKQYMTYADAGKRLADLSITFEIDHLNCYTTGPINGCI